MVRITWLVSQLIPPALLTYFGRTLYLITTEIGPGYIRARAGRVLSTGYIALALVTIPAVSILYLRLYFLPANQGIPPRDPPVSFAKREMYECLAPAEAEAVRLAQDGIVRSGEGEDGRDRGDRPLVNRCWRGKCKGRWKPARTRHCSECGVCRSGFDHHCALFANCLTAPRIPTFMCLLTLTPPIILLLSSPLYPSLARRALAAYRTSWSDPNIQTWWYDWPFSWIIAGGPVGRYVGGVVLGWKSLDRVDGGGPWGSYRLEIGALVGVGMILAMITAALGAATAGLIKAGHLTIDRERARSLARASEAVESLRRAGEPIPQATIDTMTRWQTRHYFRVPDSAHPEGGRIVQYQGDSGPYDHGRKGNWELIMGQGAGWLLPWQALRRGMSVDETLNWPISPAARKALGASS